MKKKKLTDYKKGFGGKFGIQEDRKDKSAHGWDECEKLQQHESQIGIRNFFKCCFLYGLEEHLLYRTIMNNGLQERESNLVFRKTAKIKVLLAG